RRLARARRPHPPRARRLLRGGAQRAPAAARHDRPLRARRRLHRDRRGRALVHLAGAAQGRAHRGRARDGGRRRDRADDPPRRGRPAAAPARARCPVPGDRLRDHHTHPARGRLDRRPLPDSLTDGPPPPPVRRLPWSYALPDRSRNGGDMTAARPWPLGVEGIAYGGDYNPEQWPREVRLGDHELMPEAGVRMGGVAILYWATRAPREGEYDVAWLDEMMDLLDEAGIKVALATATASPPPWLTHQHPELLPVTADGTVLSPGGRQAYAVSAPLLREYAVKMTRVMAE